jgi:hypothetical protein
MAEDQHDVESIETHIVKQDESSISPEQVHCLRELQEMYRKRIVSLKAAISRLPIEETIAREPHTEARTPTF